MMLSRRTTASARKVGVARLMPLRMALSCDESEPYVRAWWTHAASIAVLEGSDVTLSVQVTTSYPAYRVGWYRADPGSDTFVQLQYGSDLELVLRDVRMSDDGARYGAVAYAYRRVGGTLRRAETAGAPPAPATLTVGPQDACVVPPRSTPFDRSTPQSPRPWSTVVYGMNLVRNEFFKDDVYVGDLPTGFGYWTYNARSTQRPALSRERPSPAARGRL